MRKITLLFAILLCANFTYSQESYKKINIKNVTPQVIEQLHDDGIDLTCGVIITEDNIQMEISDYAITKLDNRGISYDILIEDMQKFYSDRATRKLPAARAKIEQIKAAQQNQRSYSVNEILNNVGQYDSCDEIDWAVPTNWNLNPNASPNSFGGCLTYDMVLQELDDMRTAYPGLISVKTDASISLTTPAAETTFEGRTVYYVRISDNPDMDEAGEPETLYQSLIHSREAATVMNQLYFMWYLLENYATDPAIQNLVNNQALYFIPVFNPDGFVYNQTQAPNGGGGQRKNRNTSATGTCGTFVEGIDLNRNSAYYWGNGGSSTNPCNDTYMGTGPFSEVETTIMKEFFEDHDFELALNHHSYKNAMLHAYAGTNITNPRPDEYSKYNHDMTFYNRYAHGPSTSISSLNSGNMNDWMLGGPAGVSANGTPTGTGSGKNTMAWTPENGLLSEGNDISGNGSISSIEGFWPDPDNYVLIAKRAMRMNFLAAYFSGKYAKLHDLTQSDISTLSGDFNFAIERLGQTDGDFTLTVTPVSTNILSVGGPSTQTGMTVLQQNNVNISYTLDPAIEDNDLIEFKVVLTNDYATDNVLYEANITKHYSSASIALFEDNPDTDNLTNWTQTGVGNWFATSDAYSGSTALRTSASAPYVANANKQLQMNGSVDLTNASSTLIQFYAKWDLERSFDYVQIEGSTDGTNWTPLCGKLTKPGAPDANNSYSGKGGVGSTSNNFQPDGEMLYDGDTQDKWNMEEIVIDVTNNTFLLNQPTVYLRFDFKTDATNREDSYYNADFEGFFFDDFKVLAIPIPCETNVPTGITVSSITATSAQIDWDNIPSATYDLRYRQIGAGSWNEVTDIATSNYTITSLSEFTNHEVQVRSRCVSATSAYSASVNFTTATQVACTGNAVSSFPYSESFETDLGLWSQSATDDLDWTRFSGLTPSNTGSNPANTTGPSAASDGTFYLYTESSGNGTGYPNKEAFLISPCFDLNGYINPEIAFDYHMFGENMGTLSLEVSIDNGASYTTLFTRSGNHPNQNANSDPWITQTVDLSAYNNQAIKLRFYGLTDTDFTSDISIDNVIVTAEEDPTLSNPTNELTGVEVYPNPFSTELIMTIPSNLVGTNFEITLFDLSGRQILNTNRILNDQKLIFPNVTRLVAGTYFLKITNNNTSITKKIIKQ